MCDLTKNGWDEHKKVVYHKIDGNTECLEKVSKKQDKILEKVHTRESRDIASAMERARFEARMGEKVNRMEKVVYGALGAGGIALLLQVISIATGGGP